MASWKKVIVSGSGAELGSVTTTGNIIATGSLAANSAVNFPGLTNVSQPNIVGFDSTTGQLYYQGTGSFTANSASYATTASYANTATSASYSETATSSSYAETATSASHADAADSAISASYALTASYANTATSASHADAADSAISASFAATASSVNTLNQPVVISGSLSINTTTGTAFDVNADTFIFTGSFNTTGSVYLAGLTQVSKSYVVGYDETTGLLTYQTAVDNADTASFAVSASHAVTASYSETATSASHANASDTSISSSYSATATTASYAETATSASHADAADTSISSSYALTASYALNVPLTASNADTASYALYAVTASNANTASYAFEAVSASHAVNADFAYAVTGSSTLTSGSIVLWDGAAFADSSITQDTGVVLIDNPGGVLIQQGGLYVTGSSTFHDNVTIQGDLTVNGTASFQNVTNLAVVDQFILLNSGSSTFQDSGIVINTGNAQNSGSAFFLETAGTTTGTDGLYGRFAVAVNVLPDATSATAAEYANTTTITAAAPGNAVPQFGGTGLGQGNTWVDTTTSDIWIYA